ncbi:MAG: DUF58 domain-containing protein [Verrucomicrobiota bacterium]
MATRNANLLDPAAIAKGEALGVIARGIVEGYRVGEHRSPFHGFAIEFAQHREYATGDDLRHLDWKVLGRTDRYYIKQYEQDTNFVAHLVVDGSESMAYGSGTLTKLGYAKVLAACLAHLVLGQSDAVALSLFDTGVRDRFERTDNAGRIHEIMNRLAAFEAGEGTDTARVLNDLAAVLRSRGIVVLISDLFDDEEGLQTSIERIRFQGTEVIVFHVLDPYEIDFPFQGTVKFVGLEGGPRVEAMPASIRKSYLQAFGDFRTRMRALCDRCSCHYVLCNTGVPLHETLSEYLAFRRNHLAR